MPTLVLDKPAKSRLVPDAPRLVLDEPMGFWQKTKQAWDIGGKGADLDFQWRGVKYGTLTRAQAEKNEAEFHRKLKENPLEARNWLENVYLKTVSIAHPMVSGQAKGLTYGTIGAGMGAMVIPGPDPLDIVTAPSGFAIGNIVGAYSYWAEQGEGSIYREAIKAGLSYKTASTVSSIGGPIYGAIEFSQVDKIIPKLGGFAKRTVLSAIVGYLKRIGVEVLEEGEQKIVTEGAVKLLGEALEGKLAAADIPDTAKEMGLSAIGEMKEAIGPMTLLTLPGGSIDVGKAIITKPTVPAAEVPAKREVRLVEEPIKAPAPIIPKGIAPITKTEKTQLLERGLSMTKILHTPPEELRAIIKQPPVKPIPITIKDAEKQIADITQKPAKPIPKEVVTPPAVQRELSQENLGPVNLTTESQRAIDVLDEYWKLRDEAEFEANVDETVNQEAIAKALGKKRYNPDVDADTARASQAMMLYIDLKEHPAGHEFAKQLTGEQKQIYDLSQNLPPAVQQVADQITAQNKKAGLLLKDQDIIRNVRENYIAHIWEKPSPRKQYLFAKFRQKTVRALPRTLEGGIVEGWTRDMKLKIKDVTTASRIARQQGTRALAGKKLLDMGKDWGLMGHKQLEGWRRVEHPNFTIWRYAGKAEPGKVYGRDLYVNEKGDLFEKSPVYAEPVLAAKLNRIFSPSALYKLPGVETITFYNDQIKSTILITALFHHQAFLRSNMLGGRTINVKKSWQAGKQAIKNKEPELRLLVRNGLTIGKIQDYDPAFFTSRQTIWGRVLSQTNLTEKGRKFMVNLRNRQIRFLFHKMGPYLKAGTALLEFQANLIKNKAKLERGEITVDEIAKSVAILMNNDFGGLHLGRLGRGATAQHIFKLLALAPDWTESNIRSAIQMLNRGEMGRVHRLFWGRIATKGLGATIALNLMLAAFDDDDFLTRYQKAWETGRLRWLDIDITPIYRGLGGSTERRKYFSLIGHFRDPVKFVVHPFISAKHKSSVVGRIMMDLMIGQDWAGREFTTLGELTGIAEKGKLSGRLVKWGRGKAKPVEPEQVPSYLLYETRSALPIPIQNAIAFLGGEMDAFDAITKSLGLMTFTTYPSEKARRKTIFKPSGRKSIFKRKRKKSIFRKVG